MCFIHTVAIHCSVSNVDRIREVLWEIKSDFVPYLHVKITPSVQSELLLEGQEQENLRCGNEVITNKY